MIASLARMERPPLTVLDPVVLVPRLTAFLAISTAARSPGRVAAGVAVAAVVFALPRAARNGWFWIGVAAVFAVWNAADWATLDNHIYLASYWYLALGLALLSRDPAAMMARHARLLVGAVFAVAVVRKVTTPEFVNGDFFTFTLLVDERFARLAEWAGGVAHPEANRLAIASLPETSFLASGSGIRPLATALTWGAIIVESAVALFNLLPARRWRRAGQWSLAVFVTVTYLIVPVVAFGAGLIVMGVASAESDTVRRNWAIGFLALAVWGFAWRGALL